MRRPDRYQLLLALIYYFLDAFSFQFINFVFNSLQLLSSLATDLDIMLNDLRSSPSSHQLLPPPTHQQLQVRSRSNHSSNNHNISTPLTVGNSGGGGVGGVNGNNRTNSFHGNSASNQTVNTNNHNSQYLQNAIRSHKQQKLQQLELSKKQHNPSATDSSSEKLRSSINLNNRQSKPTIDKIDGVSATNTAAVVGLSPEVKHIAKLPLWSYQQKLLKQQPPKKQLPLERSLKPSQLASPKFNAKSAINHAKRYKDSKPNSSSDEDNNSKSISMGNGGNIRTAKTNSASTISTSILTSETTARTAITSNCNSSSSSFTAFSQYYQMKQSNYVRKSGQQKRPNISSSQNRNNNCNNWLKSSEIFLG